MCVVDRPRADEKMDGKKRHARKRVEKGKTMNIRVGFEQSYGYPEMMVQNELSCLVTLARAQNRQFY